MSTLNCHDWYELIEIVESVDSRRKISDLCKQFIGLQSETTVHKIPCQSNISFALKLPLSSSR